MPNCAVSSQRKNRAYGVATAGFGQQGKTGKFVFPGSLRLSMKRLRKGKDSQEYRKLYNLRYRVYCHEAHFLDPEDFPSGREMDEFDAVSEHFVAISPACSDDIVGTVRLVKWSENLLFPTAAYYEPLLRELHRLRFPLRSTAEISRLCISKQYRKRAIDGMLGIEGYTQVADRRRQYPEVMLKLFKIMYHASKNDLGITHWIASLDNCLYRLLSRFGIRLELLTPNEIDYYGKVGLYGASVDYVEEVLRMTRPDLFDYFCE